MNRVIFLISIVLIAILPSFSQPKIHVEGGSTVDLGDVYVGVKAERIILIKNIGHDSLRISDIHPGCGCTATWMSDSEKILGPNVSGKISISINTLGFPAGRVSKQVTIASNDTSSPKTTLMFNLNVMNVLNLNPGFFSFADCKVDSSYTRVLTITNPSKESIKIIGIKMIGTNDPSDQLKHAVKLDLMKNQLMPGESTQLQAVFRPTASGTFDDTIDLTTDIKTQPKFQFQIHAWVIRK